MAPHLMNKIKPFSKFLAILYLILTFSWTPGQRAEAAVELAKINEKTLSIEEFNKKYQENARFFQFRAPTKKSVLEDLIKRELGIQEAKKLGLDKDPEVLDKMNTVLYQSFIEKKLAKEIEAIHVTDEEAKKYYKDSPEIRTSHIFVALAADASPEQVKVAQERINKIYSDEIKPGKASFAEVAQRFSEGIAAPMGGDVDFQTKDKLDPAYYAAALKLKEPGAVSEVVRSQYGFHIIRLTAIRTWEQTDKPQIKRLVFEQRRNDAFERLMGSLRKTAKVTINDKLLKE